MAETTNQTPHTRTASYLAEPGEVKRVLLLYSGGLDTSVMLKWIADEYEAEVVTLTVNLGQPGEDYEAVESKARQIGAVECHTIDAREEFARDFVLPAIKANALYGGGYPLFTALGRPLIAKLAVDVARRTGCDTIAHGCTGKGNDQVRIEATIATLAPDLKVIAPVRGWQMGREEEMDYARKHGIPLKTGTEIHALLDRRQPLGPLVGGPLDRGSRRTRPRTTSSSSSRRPSRRPTSRRSCEVGFEHGVPVAVDGERLELVELLERVADIGCKHGVGIVDHIEDRIVGLKVRDIYEVPAAAIILLAHAGAREARRHDPPEPVQAGARAPVGLPRLRGPVVGAAARRPRRVHEPRQPAGHRDDRGQALQGLRARRHALVAERRLRPVAGRRSRESGGLFCQQASPGFIELWSLQSRMAHQLRARNEQD